LSYRHKRARNKRIGPRGGTERLHHFPKSCGRMGSK